MPCLPCQAALEALKEIYEGNNNSLPDNTLVLVKDKLSADPEYKKEVKNVSRRFLAWRGVASVRGD